MPSKGNRHTRAIWGVLAGGRGGHGGEVSSEDHSKDGRHDLVREEMKKTVCKKACHVDYKQAVWPESWGRGLRGAREEGMR